MDKEIDKKDNIIIGFRKLIDLYKDHDFAETDAEVIWWMCLNLFEWDTERMVDLTKDFHGSTAEFYDQSHTYTNWEVEPEDCDHSPSYWEDGWNEDEIDTTDELYQKCLACGARRKYPYVHWKYMLENGDADDQ